MFFNSTCLLLSVCNIQAFGPSEELRVDSNMACAFPLLAFCRVERHVNCYGIESGIGWVINERADKLANDLIVGKQRKGSFIRKGSEKDFLEAGGF